LPLDNKWDVVIVGSGISSLSAALLLGKEAGKKVCILESHSQYGGYLHSFKRFGKRFDTGAHYVGAMGEDGQFRALLKYLDVFDEKIFVKLDDGFDNIKGADFEFVIPTGYKNFENKLIANFPSDKNGIKEFLQIIREVVKVFPSYNFGAKLNFSAFKEATETSLGSVVEKLIKSPNLKIILYSYCALHGVSPHDISIGMHALILDGLIRGAYGFRNGGDKLADNFAQKIRSFGGEVFCNKKVVALNTSDGKVISAELENGQKVHGDIFISGADPHSTYKLFDQSILKAGRKNRIKKLNYTQGVLGIYAKVNKSLGLNTRKNYYCFNSKDPNHLVSPISESTQIKAAFFSPTSRVSDAESTTDAIAIFGQIPEGLFEKWKGDKNYSTDSEYIDTKTQLANKTLKFVDQFFPNFSRSVMKFSTSTPLTNIRYNPSVSGAPYGIYHSMSQTGIRSLSNKTQFENFFLTGQSTLMPGLLGACLSGFHTVDHLLDLEQILIGVKSLWRNTNE
jgi:all-trans-retinol 13,14-reductase